MTNNATLLDNARHFANENWDAIMSDLETLIGIDSSQDLDSVTASAPYGTGVRAALDAALAMANGYGFEVHDADGYYGFAQVNGKSAKTLGIIGHLDVVAAGEGWSVEPFALTRKSGYLVGRGTSDDKGPLLMAFHALRYWRDQFALEQKDFPCNVRFIFGCAEETGMRDTDVYLEREGAPDFLFTPDADFPVCYGEKGHFQVFVTSAPISNDVIESLTAGTVMNGVPGSAQAVVRAELDCANLPDGVEAACSGGKTQLLAHGITGHAAKPEGSQNALNLLARCLLSLDVLSDEERTWLEFVERASSCWDGSTLGLACSDDDFGALTCVASLARLEGGCFSQALDVRFPASSSLSKLHDALDSIAAELGATYSVVNESEPLIVNTDSPEVQALMGAYRDVTGNMAEPFTMGGSTYAHHFPRAVSFGAIDKTRFADPDWVGGMHAADEGVSEQALKDALVVYIVALGNLLALA